MPALPVTPEVLQILGRFVEERTGLHHGPENMDLFAEKITARAAEAGFDSLLDYYYHLRYDEGTADEMTALIDALVVNETYFYREVDQLRALVDVLLPPLLEAGMRPRIWCAACATGEEPLTIAALLADHGWLDRVDILATDISTRALERARKGEFGRRAMRSMPISGSRWIDNVDGRAVVAPELRDAIRWEQLNLTDVAAVARLGLFDAVVCRNVLIYFCDATVQTVVATLASTLRPGGHLLIGASESLLRFGTLLVCEERGGGFFYRKGD